MPWTDLITEPRLVTGIYGGAPSLRGFAVEEIVLAGRAARIKGDFAELPDPLPARWKERGFTHAGAVLQLVTLVECDIDGAPRLAADARNCMLGVPVDLSIERADRAWTDDEGRTFECIVVSGHADFLTFRMVCTHLRVDVTGYEPAPY